MIYTKRHEVLDLIHNAAATQFGDRELCNYVQSVFENEQLPHYVLTEQLIQSLDTSAISQTFGAMCLADVAKLPHDELLVELTRGSGDKRRTVFLLMAETRGRVELLMLTYDGNHFELIPHTMRVEVDPATSTLTMHNSPNQSVGDYAGALYIMTVVLSHTRGIAKEVVTSESMRKFNKCRSSKRRAGVAPHTVIRIGHVYTRSGMRQKFESDGVMRRPHMRKGHARKQKYGPNWSQERWIFVPACFVNYVEGDEKPAFKPKVVTW